MNSPYKQIFDRKRQSLVDKGKSKEEIREELEFMNLGRLRLASKGLIRADAESSLNGDDQSTVSREQMMAEFMQPENHAKNTNKADSTAGNKLKTSR